METDFFLESFAISTNDFLTRSNISFGFNRSSFQLHWEPQPEREFQLELHHEIFTGKEFIESSNFQILRTKSSGVPFDLRLEQSLDGSIYQDLSLFRALFQKSNRKETWTLGLQRIAIGIGRIWNPLDVVHPRDPTGLQPSLQTPVLGLRWEYYPQSLTKVQLFSSFGDTWNNQTSGIHYQRFQGRWDQGITFIKTPELEVQGFQLEGNLGNSGFEIRSEVGFFNFKSLDRQDLRGILGVDYGFTNAATVAVEYLYNSSSSQGAIFQPQGTQLKNIPAFRGKSYLGISGTYPLTTTKMLKSILIANLEDSSQFFSMEWGHKDNESAEWGVGIQLTEGAKGSEFGSKTNTFYLRYGRYF